MILRERVPWILLVLVLVLVFSLGGYIYKFRFEKELLLIKTQSKNEVDLVSILIKDKLQKREYQQVSEYVYSWANNSSDIVFLSLLSRNGYELVQYEKPGFFEHVLIEKNTIEYSYDGSAMLTVHKSIDVFYYNQRIYLYLLLLFYSFVLLVFSSLVYSNQRIKRQKKILRSEIQKRQKLEDELLELNASLEAKVQERTAELKTLNEKIGSIARNAGMSEVASGVLHNIGNVLNSVNVSVSMLRDQIKTTKSTDLQRVVDLLHENKDDLAGFLLENEKANQVSDFLSALSKQLVFENSHMISEVDDLSKNIEHIKNIISVQQSYAGNFGVKENVSISELIEDALKVNGMEMNARQIEVKKIYDDIPVLYLDKHKILQILINLFSNAKYALLNSENEYRELRITVCVDEKILTIEVKDNGVGIDESDLKQLFVYGFSKRRDGHGFGLHNCAIVANELGGKIEVYSEGLGKGACFQLSISIEDVSVGF